MFKDEKGTPLENITVLISNNTGFIGNYTSKKNGKIDMSTAYV